MKHVMICVISILLCTSLFAQDGQYFTRSAQSESDVSLQSATLAPKDNSQEGLIVLRDASGNTLKTIYGNRIEMEELLLQEEQAAGKYWIDFVAINEMK